MNIEIPSSEGPAPAGRQLRDPNRPRVLGHLVFLDGAHGAIAVNVSAENVGDQWSVGHLISIQHDGSRVVGVVCEMNAPDNSWVAGETNLALVKVELNGVVVDEPGGTSRFYRGIASYPRLGAVAHRIRAADLAAIYAFSGGAGIEIGRLSQDAAVPAIVSADELFSRHFAVIGSTGVGKTTAVCMLIRKSLAVRRGLRVLIVDPHNEFSDHFPGECVTLNSDNLELPFWMFRFDEIADIVFSGRKATSDESDALFDLIKAAKARYAGAQPLATASTPAAAPSFVRRTPANGAEAPNGGNISADTPVPYRIADAIQILEAWMGKLDQSYPLPALRALKNRLEALARDPRFRFMFGRGVVEDTMARVLSRIFRVPDEGKRVCVVQLAGLPNEVVDSVVSVLARLAFDMCLWSGGAVEVGVVCEEAHRYIPRDRAAGFGPTRAAIGRIAKEGRKYGVSIGVVTQRPSELDATVLSQCSTMFAMRLPNEADKSIVRSALAESSGSVVSFLSSLADREAIAFGEAIPTPMRMRIENVEPPRGAFDDNEEVDRRRGPANGAALSRVIRRLRGENAAD
jgi:DNA helicase HerA-like ATPase